MEEMKEIVYDARAPHIRHWLRSCESLCRQTVSGHEVSASCGKAYLCVCEVRRRLHENRSSV